LSYGTAFDVLDSEHLPIFFHILDNVGAKDISTPVETHTDWEQFRSLGSELISPRIHIDTTEEAEKATSNFTASTALAYGMLTHKLTFGTKQRAPRPRSSPAAQTEAAEVVA
jgi:hypothetical protein